ncbi:hypothetical protein MPTK1_1g02780 [Marchantia polymorpha subsp. ruderalis]|nr:hypothetical protein AXG93_2584s1260 [Marchantia polymorpha subsp. ruderalis]
MAEGSSSGPRRIRLRPERLDASSFEPFGQIVSAGKDGAAFGEHDAQLDLSRGIPRFYIMNLKDRKHLTFGNITHHARVTQCLGSIGGHTWYLGVAPASVIEHQGDEQDVVRASSGHYYVRPSPDQVRVFRVEGPHFLKLHVGTWHAGPFFKHDSMNFYNLELSDTNEVDHTTHVFEKEDQVIFEIDD